MQSDTKVALGFGLAIIALLVGGTFLSRSRQIRQPTDGVVAIEDGVQIIDITAKGGYSPQRIEAKAGVPTEIRFTTSGTYDCSSLVTIPQLGYEKMLDATGTETLSLRADQATGTLKGQCGMAMYGFQIAFTP